MAESDLQALVVQAAKLYGWRVYHTFDSRRSVPGFPDLVLCRPPALLMIELKSEKGKATREQIEWLTALGACRGVIADIWQPADWQNGRILACLHRSPDDSGGVLTMTASEEVRNRIETCRRGGRGWSCSLKALHVRALVKDGRLWLDCGLPPAALARAERAARRGRGIRLSPDEVAAIDRPA